MIDKQIGEEEVQIEIKMVSNEREVLAWHSIVFEFKRGNYKLDFQWWIMSKINDRVKIFSNLETNTLDWKR